MANREDQVKALANETRIEILRLLDEPIKHFGGQKSADPVTTGVCVQLIAEHFGVSQPTMSRHIELLRRAGLITTKRQQKWTYCSRNEAALADYASWLRQSLNIKDADVTDISARK
ncbi:ArsR/SmtB family transcription factor [Roseibium salinum]|uniref:Metalloregulator ArsR/SmtB family transcription factor n=1 Tax=Roseibium salinum TaxID=1604349 RepID=A0ABT3QX53_9HYPH|nr:metalloregulator ArsR/SmtB family transcription factor [Roseibium sp. DSM 29163]MCX2721518.1 metalloregulator ArsR/SmtB family transcription factor [Roseibium sp. DSM 29163]MDN3721991.1 metalloregulator ArsR/SmtB family transcription factor [Roseibium salinum]